MQILPPSSLQVSPENPAVYCRCKGGVISELFVKCDGDQECPNGSWLHPQCTSDLKDMSKIELDSIEEWYCEDCVARIQKEEEGGQNDEEMDEEEEEDIEIQIDQEDIQMLEQVEALNQEIDNIDLEIDQEDMIYPEPLVPEVIGDILIDREEDEMVLVNNAVDRVESDSSYGDEDESSSSNSD